MITFTIPRLWRMKYAIELTIVCRGWGRVLRQMFWPKQGES